MNAKILRFLFWFYTAVVMYFAFAPLGLQTPVSDKVNHFIAFFIYAILLKESYNTSYWGSFFYSTFFCIFIEAVQYFLPYRSSEYGDVLAGILGITSGIFMYFVVKLTYLELKEEE